MGLEDKMKIKKKAKRKFANWTNQDLLDEYGKAGNSFRKMADGLSTDRSTLSKEFRRRGLNYSLKRGLNQYTFIKKKEKEELKPYEKVLNILRGSTSPILESDLLTETNLSDYEFTEAVKYLDNKGFDVKKIYGKDKTKYSLVRFGTHTSEHLYKILGKISLPAIISSDWHLGSYGFSEQAFDLLIDDCKQYGVKAIINAGDVLQGRGVHRLEAQDVRLWNLDEQVAELSSLMKKLPNNVKMHCVIGNHEEKIKGSIVAGYDPLKAAAKQIPNLIYYGHVAKLGIGDTEHSLMMLHSSGGITYAASYRIQRIYSELFEKPNLLVIGHDHKLEGPYSLGPVNSGYQSGTLQRENSFLLNKGHMSTIGWHILLDYKLDKINSIMRRPATF